LSIRDTKSNAPDAPSGAAKHPTGSWVISVAAGRR
jgi:hypothetical protein